MFKDNRAETVFSDSTITDHFLKAAKDILYWLCFWFSFLLWHSYHK